MKVEKGEKDEKLMRRKKKKMMRVRREDFGRNSS